MTFLSNKLFIHKWKITCTVFVISLVISWFLTAESYVRSQSRSRSVHEGCDIRTTGFPLNTIYPAVNSPYSITTPDVSNRFVQPEYYAILTQTSHLIQYFKIRVRIFNNSQFSVYSDVELLCCSVNNFTNQRIVSASKKFTEKLFACDICGKLLLRRGSLINHQRTHTGEKPFKCQFCGKGFTESGGLLKHRRTHTGEKPFKCEICDKGFSESGSLLKHRRTHSGEKPFKCDVCGKVLSRKGSLVYHRRIHSSEKPFTCHICLKGFSESKRLAKHRSIHTADKHFKCEICGKGFPKRGQLAEHLRRHMGDKPYKCDVCEKLFSAKSDLVKHQRTHIGK